MKSIYKLVMIVIMTCFMLPAQAKKEAKVTQYDFSFPTTASVSTQYGNLDYGLRIQVKNDANSNIVNISELNSKEAKDFPNVYFENTPQEAAQEALDRIASGLGFKVGMDSRTDFILSVTITDARLRVREYNPKKNLCSSTGTVVIRWELLNAGRDIVISSTTVTGRDQANGVTNIMKPLGVAFSQAMLGISWDAIASSLKVAKNAREEKNAQVSGEGNTALEHTVIRWYIQSRPAGADVSWRVISSTPDVANTNSNYVGNTPYESTESFDIKGLTYNNSGNVQIEVTCERNGYIPQKKRFNLRQVIDQKEISALFKLVKEEAEE